MRHTVSDGSGRYDPLDIASLQLWQQGQQEDNRQQIRRLLVNLPLAVEEELTPRQRQLLRMHFTQGKRVTDTGAGDQQVHGIPDAGTVYPAAVPHAAV